MMRHDASKTAHKSNQFWSLRYVTHVLYHLVLGVSELTVYLTMTKTKLNCISANNIRCYSHFRRCQYNTLIPSSSSSSSTLCRVSVLLPVIVFPSLRYIFYPNVTTLRSGLCCRNSVCLSSVCNVGAPYSEGWSFRQNFFTAVYAGHPLTSMQNFTEMVLGEPLRRGR